VFRKRSVSEGASGLRDTSRLEAFSDGVFAIAITLLILEIHIPTVEEVEGESTLFRALLDLWPSYFGYLVSFLVIGIMWINHHNIFHCFRGVDHWLLTINLLLLLCISFIPFPTALLAEHITHPDERTATVFYAAVFFVTACVFNLLWRYPTRYAPRLLKPDVDPAVIAAIDRRFSVGPLLYLVALILSWFLPMAGMILLALLALLYLIPARMEESAV
jgi:TMEM175 potassium channel family protein